MKLISGSVCAAQGFTANGVHCGVRANKTKKDLSRNNHRTVTCCTCEKTTSSADCLFNAEHNKFICYTCVNSAFLNSGDCGTFIIYHNSMPTKYIINGRSKVISVAKSRRESSEWENIKNFILVNKTLMKMKLRLTINVFINRSK